MGTDTRQGKGLTGYLPPVPTAVAETAPQINGIHLGTVAGPKITATVPLIRRETVSDEPKYTWHATGVNGHSEKLGSDFLYTSNDAPVEADEYNRQYQRAEAAEQRLLDLQVDRSKTVKLRDETDTVIWSLKPDDVPGAINWGDLGCREVQEVINDERRWYRVVIEEADPVNPALHDAVLVGLVALGWNIDDLEIETAW
jgi:hypothetical protein